MAINVTLKENVLTVVTPIKKEVADKAFSRMIAKDEDGNEVLCVVQDKNGKGDISAFGLTCNTVVDGCLATVMILPEKTTMNDVKKLYGKDLVHIDENIEAIVQAVEKEIAAIDDIFEAEAETEAEAE